MLLPLLVHGVVAEIMKMILTVDLDRVDLDGMHHYSSTGGFEVIFFENSTRFFTFLFFFFDNAFQVPFDLCVSTMVHLLRCFLFLVFNFNFHAFGKMENRRRVCRKKIIGRRETTE